MPEKEVRPERRRVDRRHDRLIALGDVVDETSRDERRVHCWDLESGCTDARRRQCAAYFVRRNCWDLWAAEFFPPGRKPCCHPELDCSECPITAAKFGGSLPIYVSVPRPSQRGQSGAARASAYCPYLYSVREGAAGREGDEGKPVFRCQRRHGVKLHGTYVNEVCGSADHRQCMFYEMD